MARFNQSVHRNQRYILRGKARRLIAAGKKPLKAADGKLYFVIDGRHYVLPQKL